MPEVEYLDDLSVMKALAKKGGALARSFAGEGLKSWDKTPGDPVSEADLAVNALLKEGLLAHRSDYGWLSEESQDDESRLSCKRIWVVDPIDGTRAFIKGRPEYVISIAMVEDGEAKVACLYDPCRDDLYHAIKSEGAYLNDETIQVADRSKLEDAKIVAADDFIKSRLWPKPWPRIRSDNPNSIALRLALVAKGARHAAFTLRPKNDWDLAAAGLILEEAGGCVSDHKGAKLVYNRPKPIHRTLVASC
ncbi:MAG: 3'(2'),5'-bisphosphate nucleotidase CysQ, partial [Sphingomonadales bacterium]